MTFMFERPDEDELTPAGRRLARWRGIAFDRYGMVMTPNNVPGVVIPFTDEAADFFSSVLMGLNRMAMKVDSFVKDQGSVIEGISRVQANVPLLAP